MPWSCSLALIKWYANVAKESGDCTGEYVKTVSTGIQMYYWMLLLQNLLPRRISLMPLNKLNLLARRSQHLMILSLTLTGILLTTLVSIGKMMIFW